MNEEMILKSAVSLLIQLKQNLEHQRRFEEETFYAYRGCCFQTERDIEQWLHDKVYLKYPHSF